MSGRNDGPMKQTRDDPIKQTRNETAVITPTARVAAARLAIAVAGALLPASWAARARTASALRAE